MRFGARARAIKNKPKVNREFTIPELKKLLEAREADIEILQQRIAKLESYLAQNNYQLPADLPSLQASTLKAVALEKA